MKVAFDSERGQVDSSTLALVDLKSQRVEDHFNDAFADAVEYKTHAARNTSAYFDGLASADKVQLQPALNDTDKTRGISR